MSLTGSLLIGCGSRGGDGPAPTTTVRLTVARSSITAGESVTLTWTSTNATSVVSSNFGATAVSGTKSVSPAATTTYSITVRGSSGDKTATVTVTVDGLPAAPTLALTATPDEVTQGESTTLAWTSTNATSVVASTFGATVVGGTKTVSPPSTTTYTLTVLGPGGRASDSVTVIVTGMAGSLDAPGVAAGEERLGLDGGTYVWVPAGEFMMGSEETGRHDQEKPQHRVQLTRGFWLSRCETTNAQYRRFCKATGREFPWDSDTTTR